MGVNSQYGDQLNFWLYATNDDTGGPNQTAWLEQVRDGTFFFFFFFFFFFCSAV